MKKLAAKRTVTQCHTDKSYRYKNCVRQQANPPSHTATQPKSTYFFFMLLASLAALADIFAASAATYLAALATLAVDLASCISCAGWQDEDFLATA